MVLGANSQQARARQRKVVFCSRRLQQRCIEPGNQGRQHCSGSAPHAVAPGNQVANGGQNHVQVLVRQ